MNPDNSEDATQDADNDSLSNEDEFTIGTNPTNSDSDGDGWTDKQENDWGWDPNFDESQNGSPQIEPTTVVLDYDVDSIYKTYDGFYEPWTSTVNFDGPRTIVFNHSNTGHTLHTEYKYTSEYSNGTTYTKQYNEKVNYVPNNKFFRIINGNTKVIQYFLFEVDETHSSSIKLSISGSPCSFVMSYRNLVKKSFLVESWYDPAYNDETHDYFQTDATEENRVPNSPETLKTAIIEWTGEKILINGKVVNQGYDLKDLTGGNWEGRLLKVDLDIDATTPSASKLNFYVSDSIPISKATLLRGNENIGWLQEDEKLNLVGNGFLTFDQNSIGILEFDENNSQIDRDLKLELTIAGNIIELPIIADRVDHSKDAVELITGFWIDVGTRVFNHTIRETYSDYVYSVPASGKLRKLISSYASVNLGSSQFSAGTESHKYNPDGGPSQNMSTQSGLGDPNTVYWTNHSNLWIDKFETTINEGVCTNSGINVLTGTGSAFGGSTNNSVDVTID